MSGPLDYFLSFVHWLVEAALVVYLVRSKLAAKYFYILFYCLAVLTLSLARHAVLFAYGLTSPQYFHFYFFSDAFLTVCLFFVLMGLYTQVFADMGISRYLRVGAVVLLGGTAWFSYLVVSRTAITESHLIFTRIVLEMSQNLYFVGLVLTYLLWAAMLKVRENRLRLIQLVLALGIYFSLFAANYALVNMQSQLSVLTRYLPPLMAVGLPLAWLMTFWKVPEEARLATARVAPAHHK